MDTLYAIGIDLGTSNSALALAAPDGSTPVQILTVEQLTSATTSARKPTLPSALYLCTEPEQRSFATLPWQEEAPAHVIGQLANEHGFRSPQRLVTSAKSWLCQHHHDPQKPLLPWQSQLEITLPSIVGQPVQRIPVTLHSHITDLGTLELWMQHDESGQRWKIEFNVRGH